MRAWDVTVEAREPLKAHKEASTLLRRALDAAGAASERLVVEQWNGSRLLGQLTAESFASTYKYEIELLHDDQSRETGGRFTVTDMPAGSLPAGRLRLERYHFDEGLGTETLDALFDFTGFASETALTVDVNGDPANPTGADINLGNAAAVPGQLIQLVRYPDQGVPQRFVLAGADADPDKVTLPVVGQNFRWDAIPRAIDLSMTLERQANGLPGLAVIDGDDSDAPAGGRIETTTASRVETVPR